MHMWSYNYLGFLKPALFFIALLFCFPLYAQNEIVTLDHTFTDHLFCTDTECFFPEQGLTTKDIYVVEQVDWDKDKNLILHTKGNIVFKKSGKIVSSEKGSIILRSGMEPGEKEKYDGTVVFEGPENIFAEDDGSAQIMMLGAGSVEIYYNPTKGEKDYKYHNAKAYSYSKHIKFLNRRDEHLETYMLVNDRFDLQNIIAFLSGSYALSQDIDATNTKNWHDKKGFEPLKDDRFEKYGFSGNFNGNGYAIKKLFINRPEEDDVGLFSVCGYNTIKNLILEDFNITGAHRVGSLAGEGERGDLKNITVINPTINSQDGGGGIVGAFEDMDAEFVEVKGKIRVTGPKNIGSVFGSVKRGSITLCLAHENDFSVLDQYPFVGHQDESTKVFVQICL